jgi:hypothetical protein
MMKEKAGSTKAIDVNYAAIQDYVVGKTVADLEADLKQTKQLLKKWLML